MPPEVLAADSFSDDERRALEPYFTNVDKPVFALTNLPEVVKGALFARYSRSPNSVRRLFLDEFLGQVPTHPAQASAVGVERAETLYERVFNEYGDDSVAQLGGAHIACEGVSNVLTKVLERGRLMAYLEQSTRYVPYTDRPRGRWKYWIPREIEGRAIEKRYGATLDLAFETYARWLEPLQEYFRGRYPKTPADSDVVYKAAIRAKALDTLRGLLPAATRSNVGIFGTGQAFEGLLLNLSAHPLAEARELADLMLPELRKVIPAFLTRVDREERGVRWSHYLAETRAGTKAVADSVLRASAPLPELRGRQAGRASATRGELDVEPRPDVVLTEFDPDGEVKVVAAALYASSHLADDQLLAMARRMTAEERLAVLRAYVGNRTNRRHKPGRAFERTSYRFDVLSDYGAFRDLQRHRLLTVEWQELTTRHGYGRPAAIDDVGAQDDWERVMAAAADLYELLCTDVPSVVAQYAVAMAYRIRYCMQMNAREAMHIIELRTAPQGHPAYRRICQAMYRLIADEAGHQAIAAAMAFADHSEIELERLEAERAAERRRNRSQGPVRE